MSIFIIISIYTISYGGLYHKLHIIRNMVIPVNGVLG